MRREPIPYMSLLLRNTADSTDCITCSCSNGFERKQSIRLLGYTCRRNVAFGSKPDIIMRAAERSRTCIFSVNSVPFMSVSCQSMRMAANFCSSTRASASAPDPAVFTCHPARRKIRAKSQHMSGSSSTTKIHRSQDSFKCPLRRSGPGSEA